MSHGSKGKREQGSRALPIMPGLPVAHSVTDAEIKDIGRVWQHQPSESKFDVPTRQQIVRNAGKNKAGKNKAGKKRSGGRKRRRRR